MFPLRYDYSCGKIVVIESQNRNKRKVFQEIYFDKQLNKSYLLYRNIIYEDIGICKMTNKTIYKKAKDQILKDIKGAFK